MHQKEEETGCLHHYPVGERWGDRLACLPAQHPLETTWEEGHGVPLGGLFQAHWAHHRLQSLGYLSHFPHPYGVITLLKDEREVEGARGRMQSSQPQKISHPPQVVTPVSRSLGSTWPHPIAHLAALWSKGLSPVCPMSSLSLMHQSPCCMTPTLVIRTYLCTAHQDSRRLFSDAHPSKVLKLRTHTHPPLPTSLPPSRSFSPNISYAVLWGHKVLLLLLLLHPQPSCQHCPWAPRSPPLSAPITSSQPRAYLLGSCYYSSILWMTHQPAGGSAVGVRSQESWWSVSILKAGS